MTKIGVLGQYSSENERSDLKVLDNDEAIIENLYRLYSAGEISYEELNNLSEMEWSDFVVLVDGGELVFCVTTDEAYQYLFEFHEFMRPLSQRFKRVILSFEWQLTNYPVEFRSEVEEMHLLDIRGDLLGKLEACAEDFHSLKRLFISTEEEVDICLLNRISLKTPGLELINLNGRELFVTDPEVLRAQVLSGLFSKAFAELMKKVRSFESF